MYESGSQELIIVLEVTLRHALLAQQKICIIAVRTRPN